MDALGRLGGHADTRTAPTSACLFGRMLRLTRRPKAVTWLVFFERLCAMAGLDGTSMAGWRTRGKVLAWGKRPRRALAPKFSSKTIGYKRRRAWPRRPHPLCRPLPLPHQPQGKGRCGMRRRVRARVVREADHDAARGGAHARTQAARTDRRRATVDQRKATTGPPSW
jgi:hypothetical protein